MKVCCLEGLAILVSEALVFLSRIGSVSGVYVDLAYVMLCTTLVLWGWIVINPGVSLRGSPNLRYFPKDTELALGMTLLELHYILQVFCVCQEDGGGVNRGS